MTDRPIIFSAPMVRALLDGRKSQTRRVLKPQPEYLGGYGDEADPEEWGWIGDDGTPLSVLDICPNGYRTGDRLYVREAFSYEALDVDRNGFMPPWYWADGNPESGNYTRLRPSIHMPRWASRLTLTVTDVRVQRLNNISAADAIAEGCHVYANSATIDCDTPDPRTEYRALWNSIHGPEAWALNPWVCALTFETHRCNIDQMPGGNHE